MFGLHVHRQQQTQQQLDAELKELRARAVEVSDLRDRLSVARAQLDELTRHRTSARSPLVLLDTLTQRLDDQTWIQGLDLRGDDLRLRGISTAPASVIETLEASTLLQEVRFEAAITRDGRGQGERFNVSARLEAPAQDGG